MELKIFQVQQLSKGMGGVDYVIRIKDIWVKLSNRLFPFACQVPTTTSQISELNISSKTFRYGPYENSFSSYLSIYHHPVGVFTHRIRPISYALESAPINHKHIK